jgi:CBS domain-containing protein
MEADDFGSLPVGENDRLVGMLSDRDSQYARSPAACRRPNARCVT